MSTHSRGVVGIAPLAVLVALLLCLPAGASAASELQVIGPLQISGEVAVDAPGAGAYLPGAASAEQLFVSAEHVLVEMAWEQGIRTGDHRPITQHVTDRGEEETQLEQVTLSFQRDQGQPLAFLEPGPKHTLHQEDHGAAHLAPVDDKAVVAVGPRPQATHAGGASEHGYWYKIEEPMLWQERGGILSATGSFTLFIHNVTIEARTAEGGTWTDWTGYRASNPNQPISEYEERITRLHVTNGTLSVDAGAGAGTATFAPSLELTVAGSVSAPSVTGQVDTGEHLYRYQDQTMQLRGEMQLATSIPPEEERTRQQVFPDRLMRLELLPGQGFRVIETQGLEALPTPDQTTWLPVPAWALGLLGAGVLATATVAVARDPSRLSVIPGLGTAIDHRHARWKDDGWTALFASNPEKAATSFKRASTLKPNDPLACFQWALAEYEADHPERCLELLDRAEEIPGTDPLDLLEARAAAAHKIGDDELFDRSLTELATKAPGMARSLLEALDLDPERAPAPPREQIEPKEAGGYNDGYA